MTTINEGSSGQYTATLTAPDGTPVIKALLTTVTLTLTDRMSGTIINSRTAQNVLDANNVTIDVNGVLTWLIQPEDTVIVENGQTVEERRALFRFTWGDGLEHNHLARFEVLNLAHVP